MYTYANAGKFQESMTGERSKARHTTSGVELFLLYAPLSWRMMQPYISATGSFKGNGR